MISSSTLLPDKRTLVSSANRIGNNRLETEAISLIYNNKANLRDLIAATGLVILPKLDSNCWFFSPCDLEIWWITSKDKRAPLLYYIKICESFQNHSWIQTGVTVRKRSIRIKIGDILSRVSLNFDGWPWKTIGHLLYTMSSLVHHFKAMGEFKLELQSGKAQFGSKSSIFCSVWPWNLMDDSCDRPSNLTQIGFKSSIFPAHVILKFDGWPWKTIGHLFYVTLSFVHHFKAIGELKMELQSGNAQFGSKWAFFCPV